MSNVFSSILGLVGLQSGPKLRNNKPLSKILEDFEDTTIWPFEISIIDVNHNTFNSTNPDKQLPNYRLELAYTLAAIKKIREKVKARQETGSTRAKPKQTKTFSIPQQVLRIDYAELDTDTKQFKHATEYHKIGGQEEYGNFDFNQNDELVRIHNNQHSTPLVALDDPIARRVFAFGYQEVDGSKTSYRVFRTNTLENVATFQMSRLGLLFFNANKENGATVFPLAALKVHSLDGLGGLATSNGTMAAAMSPESATSKDTDGGTTIPPPGTPGREAFLEKKLLQQTKSVRKLKKHQGVLETAICDSTKTGRLNAETTLVRAKRDLVESETNNMLVSELTERRSALTKKNSNAGAQGEPANDDPSTEHNGSDDTCTELDENVPKWICIAFLERDLIEGEKIVVRDSKDSKTSRNGCSGVVVGNMTGRKPRIKLLTTQTGRILDPPSTTNIDTKFIFVNESL